MGRLNKELFDYYTQPENINCVVDIYRDFTPLKQQLIEEFWTEVNADIIRKLNTKEWYVEFTNDFDNYEIEIAVAPYSIYSEKNKSSCWLSYWHCNAKCYLRLWAADGFEFDYPKIMKKADEYKTLDWKPVKFTKKGNEEVLWKWANLDFTVVESLETIIPSNRKIMVEKFAERMADAAKTLKPLMEFIHKSRM